MRDLSRPRRWWRRLPTRFSVRAAMALILVLGGLLGWVAHQANVQRDAVAAIRSAGGTASYHWVWDDPSVTNAARGVVPAPWLGPLIRAVGPDYFASVRWVGVENADNALMAHIGRLGRLNHLQLDYDKDSPAEAGLAQLRGLSHLEILNVNSSGKALQRLDLAGVEEMGRIKDLHLAPDVTDADLAHLAGLTSLWSLSFGGRQVTDAGLAHLRGLTDLRSLEIHTGLMTAAGLVHLRGMKRLGILSLNRTGVESLKPLEGLTGFGHMELNFTPIDDAGLAAIEGFSDLGYLDLRGTHVSDAGLVHLANLMRLGRLDLSKTAITDAGLARLGGLPGLRILKVADTQVSDDGLMHLVGAKALVGVVVERTRVTAAGSASFQKARPGVWVQR